MTIEEKFERRKSDSRFNTSYPLNPAQWQKFKSKNALSFGDEKELSLYIHIPFCPKLCRFCEYIRFKSGTPEIENRYLQILQNDLENFSEKQNKNTILQGFDIGGGTPTALSNHTFQKLLEIAGTLAQKFPREREFLASIESSFTTINDEKIEAIAQSNLFQRISFGLQNINPAFLKSQNRDNGTLSQAARIFEKCRSRGIKILNIDLMYGFANQSNESLRATIAAVKCLMPEHLTIYELRTNMLTGISATNHERCFQQYNLLYELITSLGYMGNYGANTFSRIGDNGLSSYLKNRMFAGTAYKGFGIAAQSKNRTGLSYNVGKNHESLEFCLAQKSFETNGDCYLLPPEELAAKYVAICGYAGRFRISKLHEIANKKFDDEFDFLTRNDFLSINGDFAEITRKGFANYGAVFSLFYPIE